MLWYILSSSYTSHSDCICKKNLYKKYLLYTNLQNKQTNQYKTKLEHRPHRLGRGDLPVIPRSESTSEFMPLEDKEVEYFFASDASAVIEHTNRVIYLEVRKISSFKKHVFLFVWLVGWLDCLQLA